MTEYEIYGGKSVSTKNKAWRLKSVAGIHCSVNIS